jgi:hypothetical protein
VAADGAEAPGRDLPGLGGGRGDWSGRIVTVRPGGSQVVLAVLLTLCLAAIAWVGGRVGGTADDWRTGSPVLVIVTRQVDGAEAEVTEYQSTRTWTVARRALDQAASDELGTRIQARVVGDCRCQLMLRQPRSVPTALTTLVVIGLAGTVPGLLARRRWRYRNQLLARPSTPVTVSPVWLRRPFRPAVWGVRVAPGPGRPALYLELAGTALTWLPTGARLAAAGPADGVAVELHGPDPRNGLCILAAPAGLAVASAAPRSGTSGARLVVPWSDALSVTAGLVAPAPERPIEVGGVAHTRISVGGGPADRAGTDPAHAAALRHDPPRVAATQAVAVVAAYAVTAVVVRTVATDLVTAATWLVAAGLVAGLLARRLVVRRMAAVAPLGTWTDRAAARAAAASAAAAGLVPSRRVAAPGAS